MRDDLRRLAADFKLTIQADSLLSSVQTKQPSKETELLAKFAINSGIIKSIGDILEICKECPEAHDSLVKVMDECIANLRNYKKDKERC